MQLDQILRFWISFYIGDCLDSSLMNVDHAMVMVILRCPHQSQGILFQRKPSVGLT